MYFGDLKKCSHYEELCMLTNTGKKRKQAQKSELESRAINMHQAFTVKLRTSWNLSQVREFLHVQVTRRISPWTPDRRNNILPLPLPRCSASKRTCHPSSLTVQLLKATVEQERMISEKGKGESEWENAKEVSQSIPVTIQKP